LKLELPLEEESYSMKFKTTNLKNHKSLLTNNWKKNQAHTTVTDKKYQLHRAGRLGLGLLKVLQ